MRLKLRRRLNAFHHKTMALKSSVGFIFGVMLLMYGQWLHAQSASRVELHNFSSNALGVTKNYRVYLPAGYDDSTERYPVVYFLRGHDFEWFNPAESGRVGGRTLKEVADDLIATGQVGKMIIVCPNTTGNNTLAVHSCGVNMLRPDLGAVAGIGTGRFEDYLVQDLIPHIDATFRTIADREHRAIDGFSLGGYMSTMLSLRHPELFSSVGSYDGTIMWYNLDDTTIPGAGPDDRNWLDPYFNPVFDNPRNVPYMLQHSASNILRAADADQLAKFNAIRFHLSMTFSDEVGNHSNNKQLISIFAEKGIKNSFSNPVLVPNAAHNYGFADQHATISLVRHWQAFNGQRLNAPVVVDFGVIQPGENSTVEAVLFNYGSTPLTISSVSNPTNADFTIQNLPTLPQTLPGKNDALSFKVLFNATAHRKYTDTLIVASNDSAAPKTRIVLRGRGFLFGQAQAGIPYAVGGTTSQLLSVNHTTGAATAIGATGTTAVRGLAIHPVTKEFYSTVPNSNGTTTLYRLSSQNGEALTLTTIYVNQLLGIAFKPDGTLFGVTAAGQLYRINTINGLETPIGASTGIPYFGLSFNPTTNKLYASTNQLDRIYIIDSNTGSAKLLGATGLGGIVPGIAFGPEGALFGITSTNNFIRIDTTNATGTLIGPTGFTLVSALAMRTDSPTVGVDTENNPTVAISYRLEQNYPNPFNPATTIRYALAQAGHVSLKIFNLAGQEIATLVDSKQNAGEHQAHWQAQGIPSGVYFYQLRAGDHVETRKMILMR
jgi:predicted alpha/beta superfamily hydrolase